MKTEILMLIGAHFACADAAEVRLLSQGEAETCGAVYKDVKLAFVPGVDAGTFDDLSLPERAAVSRAGYIAYAEWRDGNPDLVRHLRRVARGQTVLEYAG